MGYVPDSSELYFGELTPQNLFTLLCDESQNKVKSVETMEKFINIFEFDSSILNKRIKKLSLGQRKKVMIVAGHLNVSSLILMDEPFSGLDSESLNRFIEFLNQSDITYLIVSHEMDISSLIVVDHFVLQSGKIEYFNE
jgi:ABC-type multidrug transport system ATPase subunit